MNIRLAVCALVTSVALFTTAAAVDREVPPLAAENLPRLLKVLNDAHADGTDLWIYNDLRLARLQAQKENKPLFVTFRCVPCKACAGFDAEVAKGSEAVDRLAREKFIAVRQVEMKGVDLSQFEFDYDLNWAAMFIHPDGTVYARYGTQSAAGPDAFNSIEGLLATMHRVLELHANYPNNRAELAGKRGPDKPYRTALEMPGLPNKDKYRGPTTRSNCIHCHNIHDAQHFAAVREGTFSIELLYRYPLPDNVGLAIDARDGLRVAKVLPDSPAAKAGFKPGERITHINGQVMTSIADMQWALNPLPNDDCQVTVTGSETGTRTLRLARGWKASDFSWRGSMWSAAPRLQFWAPEAPPEKRRGLNLDENHNAFEVRYIGNDGPGQAARKAGLRNGDLIVAVDGKPLVNMTSPQFHAFVKLNYRIGDRLPLTIVRGGQRIDIAIELVE